MHLWPSEAQWALWSSIRSYLLHPLSWLHILTGKYLINWLTCFTCAHDYGSVINKFNHKVNICCAVLNWDHACMWRTHGSIYRVPVRYLGVLKLNTNYHSCMQNTPNFPMGWSSATFPGNSTSSNTSTHSALWRKYNSNQWQESIPRWDNRDEGGSSNTRVTH